MGAADFSIDQDLALLSELEKEIRTAEREDLPDHRYHAARRALSQYIAGVGGLDGSEMSLPDLIDEASRFANSSATRTSALAVARVAYRVSLLPEPTASNRLELRVVSLFEKGLRDIAEKAGVLKAAQTFQKFERIRQLHPDVCAELRSLRELATGEPSVDGSFPVSRNCCARLARSR